MGEVAESWFPSLQRFIWLFHSRDPYKYSWFIQKERKGHERKETRDIWGEGYEFIEKGEKNKQSLRPLVCWEFFWFSWRFINIYPCFGPWIDFIWLISPYLYWWFSLINITIPAHVDDIILSTCTHDRLYIHFIWSIYPIDNFSCWTYPCVFLLMIPLINIAQVLVLYWFYLINIYLCSYDGFVWLIHTLFLCWFDLITFDHNISPLLLIIPFVNIYSWLSSITVSF